MSVKQDQPLPIAADDNNVDLRLLYDFLNDYPQPVKVSCLAFLWRHFALELCEHRKDVFFLILPTG